ncbi:hypothetical protein [Catellatospora tritici]|uniref:hypothetical protein n=1 Tax=Catellatospora tritici TaxID=2851566 RepID=UPI001C2D0A05|nr:hypothetical protein [Catellatospora tritici]MBV1855026.1 hypothetical protein [Catellatospora tritici]
MSDLKELLDDIAERAPALDLAERALHLGKRRRRHLRAGAIAAAALAIALVAGVSLWPRDAHQAVEPLAPSASPPPSAPPGLPASCTVARLPLPSGLHNGSVSAADPTGRYLVGSASTGVTKNALLYWEGDSVRRLSLPGQAQGFTDVNSSGVAIAGTLLHEEEDSAWIYRNGRLTRLKGADAQAVAINSSGVVVGIMTTRKVRFGNPTLHPVRWATPDADPEPLPLPPGHWPAGAGVSGLDDDGTILMNVGTLTEDGRSFALRPDGSWQELSLSLTVDGRHGVAAHGGSIRNGWVLGMMYFDGPLAGGPRMTAVVWNLRTGAVSRLPAGLWGGQINAQGWVARWTGGTAVTSGTDLLPLPTLSGVSAEFDPVVSSISDDGRVLAGGVQLRVNEPGIPLRWRCS